MKIKPRLSKLIKGFGLIYFLLNCVILIVMCILAIHAKMKTNMSPGFVLAIPPLIGIFSGYWMRIEKYGWWRISIIIISLVLSSFILFTTIFIAPKMEQIKQDKFETIKKIKTLNPEVKKMFKALYVADQESMRLQLEKGVDVNVKNETGQTPLHITQNKAILRILISKGADVNAVDENNMSPLFSKDVDLSKILVEAGADINLRSNKGNTPLIFYSYSGYIEGIQYLFSLGASVNAKNADGQTAYDIAQHFGHFKLLEYLESIGATSGKDIQ